MSSLIVEGKLPLGIEVDGKRYRKFSVRPSTLRDHCAAADTLGADSSEAHFAVLAQNAVFEGLDRDAIEKMVVGMYRRARAEGAGPTANELRYARIARCISFEGLAQEKVTVDLLMGLFDRDAEAVENAVDAVEKKLDKLSSS